MFQEFNTTSLVVDFVQQLLASAPLPVYETVQTGDIILQGRYYVYEQYIIRCIKTGTFDPGAIKYTAVDTNYVLVNDDTITHEHYVPTSKYYDESLHRRLGRYLSRLRATTGLNLFPFYNCYAGREINGIKIDSFKKDPLICGEDDTSTPEVDQITAGSSKVAGFSYLSDLSGGYEVVQNSTDRLVAIPVKFGHTYTISVDCSSRILGRCFFLNHSGNLLLFEDEYNTNVIDPSFYLEGTIFQNSATRFASPLVYTVPLVENIEDKWLLEQLYSHESSLHLVLQLPKTCTSSIAVIEGSFDNIYDKHDVDSKVIASEGVTRFIGTRENLPAVANEGDVCIVGSNEYFYTNKEWLHLSDTQTENAMSFDNQLSGAYIKVVPKLLNYNTGISYAFSDRLVEYLSSNVINSEDKIAGNIRRIQQVMEVRDFQFSRYDKQWNTYGSWHSTLSEAIARFLQSVDYQSWSKFDQDGNVNRDVEYLLSRFGGYNG